MTPELTPRAATIPPRTPAPKLDKEHIVARCQIQYDGGNQKNKDFWGFQHVITLILGA